MKKLAFCKLVSLFGKLTDLTLRYLFAQYHKQIMQILIVFVWLCVIQLFHLVLPNWVSTFLPSVLCSRRLSSVDYIYFGLWREEGQVRTIWPQLCLAALSLVESSGEDHSSVRWPSTQRACSITPHSSSIAQVPTAGLSRSSSGLKMAMVSSFLLWLGWDPAVPGGPL